MSISELVDTTAFCSRNAISDLTFYDSANIVTRLDHNDLTSFPFRYIENNQINEARSMEILAAHLRGGQELPVKPFHEDWIIIVVLMAGFLYFLSRTFSKPVLSEIRSFFIFRGAGEATAREIGSLYNWQDMFLNFLSFLSLALFVWCTVRYFDFIPDGISGFLLWLIIFGIILSIVGVRHLVCIAAGNLSSQKEAFGEYLITIYLVYRYMAIVLFVLVILLAYSPVFNSKTLLYTGISSVILFYLLRISRLALIFIRRNISILYLILYLCALEFLPVLISIKYFTGLF